MKHSDDQISSIIVLLAAAVVGVMLGIGIVGLVVKIFLPILAIILLVGVIFGIKVLVKLYKWYKIHK